MLTSSTPFIASEEFYLSPEILSSTFSSAAHSEPALHIIPPPTLSKLKNLGPSRIRDMRSSAVSQQILSHVPIDVPSKTCRKINDALHANTVMNQDRFAKLALLPCGDVAEAARELQRCVTKYKFVGGVLGFGRKDGRGNWAEWEEEGLEELWKVAERYKVPVKLSPLFPRSNEVSAQSLIQTEVRYAEPKSRSLNTKAHFQARWSGLSSHTSTLSQLHPLSSLSVSTSLVPSIAIPTSDS